MFIVAIEEIIILLMKWLVQWTLTYSQFSIHKFVDFFYVTQIIHGKCAYLLFFVEQI